jgi:NAD(P)H dehydrogenase (quinone)
MITPAGERVAFATSGATGYVGGRVAARLAEAGVDQRLIVRDRGRAPELAGAEAAEASYADPEALREALAGARIFFMVSAAEDPDRLRQHKEAVDAAVDAGVERIMYLSFLGAAPDATFTSSPGITTTLSSTYAPQAPALPSCATTGARTCCP